MKKILFALKGRLVSAHIDLGVLVLFTIVSIVFLFALIKNYL